MLRVAMVNTARSKGGAARVASLLAQAFHDRFDDVEVTLFHCEDRLRKPPFHGLRRPLSRYLNAFLARLGGSTWVWDMGVAQEIIERTRDADILHLHNLHGYYLNYRRLLHAWKDRPVVWTLHDMWCLTGRCGYSFECDKWHKGCKGCPNKNYYPKAWIDRANLEFKDKKSIFSNMNCFNIVTPSQWLCDLSIKGGISRKIVHVLPNPVDNSIFHPFDKYQCREDLNLSDKAFIALFVASDCGDPRKGYSDFEYAIHQTGCSGVAVGKRPPKPSRGILHAGSINNMSKMNRYYCAADVLIIPSYADNYPNTVIEALVGGTPVIGYIEGGIPSQLDLPHCRLVSKGDRQGLVQALRESLALGGKKSRMASELGAMAKNRWASVTVAEKYRRLYHNNIDRTV